MFYVMKIRNIISAIFVSVIFLSTQFFPIHAVYAQDNQASIGISPSGFRYNTFMPGMTYEQEFTIMGVDPSTQNSMFLTMDAGDINDWFTFVPSNEITIPQGEQTGTFTLRMTIPKGAEFKDHNVQFRVGFGKPENTSQVAIAVGVTVVLNFKISDEELRDWEVRLVSIADFYEGDDMVLTAKINNKGNVDVKPTKIKVDVEDLNGNIVKTVESSTVDEVPAYVMQEVEVKYDSKGIVPGDYFGNVTVYDGDNELYKDKVAFKVMISTKKKFMDTTFGKFVTSVPGIALLSVGGVAIILFLISRRKRKSEKK